MSASDKCCACGHGVELLQHNSSRSALRLLDPCLSCCFLDPKSQSWPSSSSCQNWWIGILGTQFSINVLYTDSAFLKGKLVFFSVLISVSRTDNGNSRHGSRLSCSGSVFVCTLVWHNGLWPKTVLSWARVSGPVEGQFLSCSIVKESGSVCFLGANLKRRTISIWWL